RSANITVSWRRSAEDAPAGGAAGAPTRWAAAGAPTPHSVQNRFSAGFSLPQAAQSHGNGDPQSPQNLQPVPTFAPHRGQFMRSLSRRIERPFLRAMRSKPSRKHRRYGQAMPTDGKIGSKRAGRL